MFALKLKAIPAQTIKLILVIVTVLTLMVFLVAYVCQLKFQSALNQLEKARYTVLFSDLQRTLELPLKLGVPVNALHNTQNTLEHARAQDSNIKNITVYDKTGVIVFSSNIIGSHQKIPVEWRALADNAQAHIWYQEIDDNIITMGARLQSAVDRPQGGLVLQFSKQTADSFEPGAGMGAMLTLIFFLAMATLLLTASMQCAKPGPDLLQTGPVGNTRRALQGVPVKLYGIAAFFAIAASMTLVISEAREFGDKLRSEVQQQSATVAQTITSQLEHMLLAGIPLNAFAGMEEYINEFIHAMPAIQYIAIIDEQGKTLFTGRNEKFQMQTGNRDKPPFSVYRMPLHKNKNTVGHIVVGVDQEKLSSGYTDSHLGSIMICVVVMVEALLLVAGFLFLLPILHDAEKCWREAA